MLKKKVFESTKSTQSTEHVAYCKVSYI